MIADILVFLIGLLALVMGLVGLKSALFRLASGILGRKYRSGMTGAVLISGTATSAQEAEPESSPLTGTGCIAYSFKITERVASGKGGHATSILHHESRGVGNVRLLTPAGDLLELATKDMDLDKVHHRVGQHLFHALDDDVARRILEKHDISLKRAGLRRSISLAESLVREGTPIRVSGRIDRSNPRLITKALVTDTSNAYVIGKSMVLLLVSLLFARVGFEMLAYVLR